MKTEKILYIRVFSEFFGIFIFKRLNYAMFFSEIAYIYYYASGRAKNDKKIAKIGRNKALKNMPVRHITQGNSRIWIDVKYKRLYIMKVEIAVHKYGLHTNNTETYRSGHNGAHSKCVCPPGHEGSNPSVSAGFRRFGGGLFCEFYQKFYQIYIYYKFHYGSIGTIAVIKTSYLTT